MIGQKIHYYKRMQSTQDVAVTMAESDPCVLNGTVVLAEKQDNGRGMQNRKWISPPGGLWLSIILKPNLHPTKGALINFITALAMCEAIEIKTCLKCMVKWPNDIIINRRKVCGIIMDTAIKGDSIYYSVVGIGVNVNVDIKTIVQALGGESKTSAPITSLKSELSGRSVNRRGLLKIFFERINCYFNSIGHENEIVGVLSRISHRLEGMGKTIISDQTNSHAIGQLIGICSEGSLLVRRSDGLISKIPSQLTYLQ